MTGAAGRCKHTDGAEGCAPGWVGCRGQCCPHWTSKGWVPAGSPARLAGRVLAERQGQGHKGCIHHVFMIPHGITNCHIHSTVMQAPAHPFYR